MKKIRIGVWLDDSIMPESGGGYSYYFKLAAALRDNSFENADIVFLSNKKIKSDYFNCKIIKTRPQKYLILKILLRILNQLSPSLRILNKKVEMALGKGNMLKKEIYQYADVVYYLTPSCYYPDFPYIYTLWDLGHLSTYAFPELSLNGVFETRKRHHDLLPQKALLVFAESKTGKKQCEKYLGINPNRVKVVPFFSSVITENDCLSVKPDRLDGVEWFIHYPAQFWAHKNHYNLLAAMSVVLEAYADIKLVLTGADKGNKDYVLGIIKNLKLEDSVIVLGYIPIEELRWLYENSQGLVMPTLLGPTNIPLLEAAELGCSVACSNLPGHIEQLGEYGYYFNGIDPLDMASKLIMMLDEKKNGITRKYENKFNINLALKAIDEAFVELRQIRSCWGENDWIH